MCSSDLFPSHDTRLGNAIQKRFTDRCQGIDRLDFQLVEGDGQETMVREWYRYGVHSSPGDCGSAVVVYDPSAMRKLIGIHMAGYNADGCHGVGVAVHQELLEDLKSKLVCKNVESDLDGTFAFEGEPTERSFGDFVSFGTAAAHIVTGKLGAASGRCKSWFRRRRVHPESSGRGSVA